MARWIKYINEKMQENVKRANGEDFKPYTRASFACKCGCGANNIDNKFIDFMNYLHKKTWIMFEINSGIRCEKHNKKVGGKPNSDHIFGLAIDLKTPTVEDRSLVVSHAYKFDIERAIVYTDRGFVHLSINPKLTNPILLFNRKGEVY